MKNFKPVLIQAARLAGKLQLRHFGSITKQRIQHKKHGESVTHVDRSSNRLILACIKKHFPGHNIISEELPKRERHSEYTWYVDPLDGTTNYSIGSPLFCVSMAVVFRQEIVESVIFVPYLNNLYYAKKDAGAFLNGHRIHVSEAKRLKDSIVTISFPHRLTAAKAAADMFKKIRPQLANVRMFGSGSYSLCSVASGQTESLIMPQENRSWDIMAGMLLVNEAGGCSTTMSGKTWQIGHRGLLFSNGKIHKQLLKLLA